MNDEFEWLDVSRYPFEGSLYEEQVHPDTGEYRHRKISTSMQPEHPWKPGPAPD